MKISNLGVKSYMSLYEQRSTVLLNRISILILFFFSFISAMTYMNLDNPIIGNLFALNVIVILISFFITAFYKPDVSKFIISIFIPVSLVIGGAYAKSIGVTDTLILYLSPRMLLTITVIIPVLFFGYRELVKNFIAIAPGIITFILFDKIHNWFGVNIDDLRFEPQHYGMFIGMIILFLIFVVSSFLFLQNINYKSENKIQNSNKELIASEEILKYNNERLKDSLILVNIQKQKIEEINNNLKEANATKSKFFNIIAHDLRSPFNAMLGFSKVLLKNHALIDNKEREKLILQVIKSFETTFEFLENLLEWSRLQTERFKFNPKIYNVNVFIFETMYVTECAAKNKKISIISDIPENLTLFADKEMLQTVFRNLFSNAIKFTPEGGKIIIRAEQKADKTIISVHDTGIGMTQEKVDAIFDITKKTSTLGTNNEKGTGLGLILCKEFIEKHEGKIFVESELGKGSTFFVCLPHNNKKARTSCPDFLQKHS